MQQKLCQEIVGRPRLSGPGRKDWLTLVSAGIVEQGRARRYSGIMMACLRFERPYVPLILESGVPPRRCV